MSAPRLRIYSLPLFPLHSVLFPQCAIQLHVFEERYRVMINDCIERNEPFGIVLIREGEEVGAPAIPHEIGCVARILAVQRMDDGRMHLLVAGEERFRLLDYVEAELPYLIGRVETVEDDLLVGQELGLLMPEVEALFQRYLALLREGGLPIPEIELPNDPTQMAFCVASVAQIVSLAKQHLLELTDPRERLEEERTLLRALIEELEALSADTSSDLESEASPGVKVLIAHPIDAEEEDWRTYRHDARN